MSSSLWTNRFWLENATISENRFVVQRVAMIRKMLGDQGIQAQLYSKDSMVSWEQIIWRFRCQGMCRHRQSDLACQNTEPIGHSPELHQTIYFRRRRPLFLEMIPTASIFPSFQALSQRPIQGESGKNDTVPYFRLLFPERFRGWIDCG